MFPPRGDINFFLLKPLDNEFFLFYIFYTVPTPQGGGKI